MSIYQEIIETLNAISADLEDDQTYTDFEPAECDWVSEEFNQVWEGR